MPNATNLQPPSAGHMPPLPAQIAAIHTDNLHLACLLHTCDVPLLNLTKSTALGQPRAIWWFVDTPVARELSTLWLQCAKQDRAWAEFTPTERSAAIHAVAGFCNMLKTTIRQAKECIGQ